MMAKMKTTFSQCVCTDVIIFHRTLRVFTVRQIQVLMDLLLYLWLAHGAGTTPGSKQEPAKLTFDRSKIILEMEYEKAVYGDWGLPDVFSSVRDSLVFNRADRSVTRNYQILSSKKGPNTGGSVIDLQ